MNIISWESQEEKQEKGMEILQKEMIAENS